MIKLDLHAKPLVHTPGPEPYLGRSNRLLVLIPTGIDYSAATRQVWKLARAMGMPVQLLGLCKNGIEQPELQRELVTMTSLLQDGKVVTEARVAAGSNWIEVVKSIYRRGDLITCFGEQRTGLLQRPLGQVLESNLKATVYVFSNVDPQDSKTNALAGLTTWLVFLGIVIGFGILQAKIVQSPAGWLQSILLILSLIPEFWLIWILNRLVA